MINNYKMSELNVLKQEIDSLSEYQKELHAGDLNTRFSCDVDKYSWSTHIKVKMAHTVENDEVVYTASKKYDVLLGAEMNIQLLRIRVKDKLKNLVRICYPHNPGHNICNKAQLKVDDEHHQIIDSVGLDIKSQFFMKSGAGKREVYNRMVGNIPSLIKWQTELPGIQLKVPQPYYYARNTRVGLVTLGSTSNIITHTYKIRNKIRDIIRMQVRNSVDEEFRDVPCTMKYLDIQGNAKELPIPKLKGKYALMSDVEREWYKSRDPSTTYIEDTFITRSNNPIHLGEKDSILLQCKSPVKSLHWVAQNVKEAERNNLSNYTTNPTNLYEGRNPCSNVNLKYGHDSRLENWSSDEFDSSEPWDSFPSAPSDPGYNGYSFGHEQGTLNADTAIILNDLDASLHITLKDNDPFKIREDDEDSGEDIIPIEESGEKNLNKDKYIIHVRGYVYKKLISSWDEKNKSMKYLVI